MTIHFQYNRNGSRGSRSVPGTERRAVPEQGFPPPLGGGNPGTSECGGNSEIPAGTGNRFEQLLFAATRDQIHAAQESPMATSDRNVGGHLPAPRGET